VRGDALVVDDERRRVASRSVFRTTGEGADAVRVSVELLLGSPGH
jgi:hypothetical protein